MLREKIKTRKKRKVVRQQVGSPLKSVLLLITIWLAPVVALCGSFWLITETEKADYTAPRSETVQVGEREDGVLQGIDVVFKAGAKPTLEGAFEGVVTSTELVVGQPLEQGKKLFSVEGEPIIAYGGATPFFRELSLNDEGEDVLTLTALLIATGYLSWEEPSDGFNYVVSEALQAFQKDRDLEDDGVLRPADFIFVSSDFGAVSDLRLELGKPFPSDGIAASGSGTIEKVSFLLASDGNPVKDHLEPIVLRSGESEVQYPSTRLSVEERKALFETLRTWAEEGVIQAPAEEDNTFSFSGVTISLAAPVPVGVVPNTAIFVGKNGTACVVEVSGAKDIRLKAIPTEIDTIGSEIGITAVKHDLVGLKILRDASSVTAEGLKCQ